MSREWKPGDVAMMRCRDGAERVAILTDRGDLSPLWIAKSEDWGRLSDDVPVRPLVVIDPEDREAVERFWRLFADLNTHELGLTGALQAALREFANPTPPKPDEPQGDGAVIECHYDGKDGRAVRLGGSWTFYGDALRDHGPYWDDFEAVRVLSEGVAL